MCLFSMDISKNRQISAVAWISRPGKSKFSLEDKLLYEWHCDKVNVFLWMQKTTLSMPKLLCASCLWWWWWWWWTLQLNHPTKTLKLLMVMVMVLVMRDAFYTFFYYTSTLYPMCIRSIDIINWIVIDLHYTNNINNDRLNKLVQNANLTLQSRTDIKNFQFSF